MRANFRIHVRWMLVLGAVAGCAGAPEGPSGSGSISGAGAGDAAIDAEVETPAGEKSSAPAAPAPESRGRAAAERVAALERQVKELRAQVEAAIRESGLPDDKRLLELFDSHDAPGLSAAIEELALAGEVGFAILHKFFAAIDEDRPKMLEFTHDPQFIFGSLRVVAEHPDAVAGLSRYLIHATRSRTNSFIRRELYNFVPVFLKFHRGKYAGLQEELEKDIVYQIEHGGDYFYKITLAMKALEFEPPLEAFRAMLFDPEKSSAVAAVQHLAARGAPALPLLVEFVDKAGDARSPAAGRALRAIARLDAESGGRTLERFFAHPSARRRFEAVAAYFELSRQAKDASVMLDWLQREPALRRKQRMLGLLVRENPAVLDGLSEMAGELAEDADRALLERALTARKRRAEREMKRTAEKRAASSGGAESSVDAGSSGGAEGEK